MAAAVSIAVALILGCTQAFRLAKPSIEGQAPPAGTGPAGSDTSKVPTVKDKKPEFKAAAPPPEYGPPPPPPPEKLSEKPIDRAAQAEVSDAALSFAKSIPDVKHIKVCHSKLYAGGWYLFLYIPKEKGKKFWLHQYSWNERTKEWEAIPPRTEVPADRIDQHLKVELEDEKCFVLK
jgi:hypothetical protein